ncbi:MAG: BamA/TamA family outer membrane protein, partial [Epsilonproteobacteria bacterium]|nr:BamA/TamA family outer membrane protein [Campylobacterota bacterium]
VGVNKENDVVLPTGVFKREPMLFKFLKETQHVGDIKDFDNLSIPFRAVATDIKNGDAVVLKSGSLAKAIYASSSIPGGFQPINIDGKDLVDGGVSDNMPIGVAKAMGADIIIAVDVSENFEKDLDVDSYFVVMGQLVNILMRKNANESIATLDADDILLTPDLKGFSGLDAEKYAQIIQKGVEVTQKSYASKLKKLSLNDEDYEKYKQKYRKKHNYNYPIIDEIKIQNPTYISDESILKRLHIKAGDRLDIQSLKDDLMHIYNMMIFDSVEYDIERKNDKNILIITTKSSWDNHGEVRFALGVEDDFKGHSEYSIKLGYTMFGINKYGAEWKSDFEIGQNQMLKTEFFQPLDSMQRFYVKPSIMYKKLSNVIPVNRYNSNLFGDMELSRRRYGVSLALGMHISTDYEFEVGASVFKDNIKIENAQIDEHIKSRPVYLSLKTDSLDNLNFPKSGVKSKILWTKEMESFDSEYNYEQIYAEFEKPITIASHNITTYLKYGNTYKNKNIGIMGSFSLGGLFNLSGYAPYSLNDENMLLGVLKYRYEIKDGGFFGVLNAPLYAGFSTEIGNTWSKGDNVSYAMMKKSASLYVAADTFLGVFYFAYGVSNEQHNRLYLYLGEKF